MTRAELCQSYGRLFKWFRLVFLILCHIVFNSYKGSLFYVIPKLFEYL